MKTISYVSYYYLSPKEKINFTGIVRLESGIAYYLNGQKHRLDGPALDYEDGYGDWYYHGQWIDVKSQEEFESYLKVLAFE